MNEYKSSLQLVDVAKFICALLVVAIHTQPCRYYETLQVWLFWPLVNLAVPYFLIVSSFLFWRRDAPNVVKYLKRIGMLYLIWLLIYSPLIYVEQFADCNVVLSVIVFFRGLLFGQTFPGSWYLNSTIWAIVISYLFYKYKINVRWLLLLGLALYILGKVVLFFRSALPDDISELAATFAGRYGELQVSSFTYFVFVFIGYLIAKDENWFNSFRSKRWIIMGILITVIELNFNHIFDYPLSVIAPLAIIPFMFVKTVTTPIDIPNNVSVRLRKMSTLIYFTHPVFVHIPLLGSTFVDAHPVTNYVLVAIVSTTIAFILSSNKLSIKIPLIKYLY